MTALTLLVTGAALLILNSAPWAYLDDAPLEERRSRAVQLRRTLDPGDAASLGALDAAAIAEVVAQAAPDLRSADELHDLLLTLVTLAPLLILFATLLFMLQGFLARRRDAAGGTAVEDPSELPWKRWTVAVLCQLGISIYGGYFGAAIGILMLAVLGFLGLKDIHAMNGLKNFFTLWINGVAAAYFIVRGVVSWPAALVVVVGSTVGGYAGARFARRIGREKARAAVVVIGLLVTAILAWQQWRG